MLDSENARLGRELVELQGRVALGERAEKEGRREALGLRQKLLKGRSQPGRCAAGGNWMVGRLPGGGGSSEAARLPWAFSSEKQWGLQCWSHSERSLPRTGPSSPLLEILPQV